MAYRRRRSFRRRGYRTSFRRRRPIRRRRTYYRARIGRRM